MTQSQRSPRNISWEKKRCDTMAKPPHTGGEMGVLYLMCWRRNYHWVGTGRVALRYGSPCPPLDPYVRLSPHTAHDRGILWERSISPAPRCILHGQLCAFAGYLCTVSRPSPSGPLPCVRFSRTRTTMPYLTACRASEFRMSLPMPTLHPPSHPYAGSPVFTTQD